MREQPHSDGSLHRFLRSLVSLFVILGVVVTVRFFEKREASEELRSELETLCADDGVCLELVDARFRDCFDTAFDLGGRSRASRLDPHSMAQCLNEGSGQSLFGVSE